jgi:O-methyltransferase
MSPAELYLDLLKKCLTRSIFEKLTVDELSKRALGLDWPTEKPGMIAAETMIGTARLDNIQTCVQEIVGDMIHGDLCETGVWRGGATIFMAACLRTYSEHCFSRACSFDVYSPACDCDCLACAGAKRRRSVWVCDSFEGLPPPNAAKYPQDTNDPHHTYKFLAVAQDEVQRNFFRYGLLDSNVKFVKGFFKDSLPGPIDRLSLLRLDGDMYESTIQVFEALYDRVSPGGFIIVDDYALHGARAATDDFRRTRSIVDPIIHIDSMGVYWRKS